MLTRGGLNIVETPRHESSLSRHSRRRWSHAVGKIGVDTSNVHSPSLNQWVGFGATNCGAERNATVFSIESRSRQPQPSCRVQATPGTFAMLASRTVARSNALGDSASSKAPSAIAARYDDSQSRQRRRQRPAILIRRDSIRSFSLPAPLTLFRRSGTLQTPPSMASTHSRSARQSGPATASLRALRGGSATQSTAAYT